MRGRGDRGSPTDFIRRRSDFAIGGGQKAAGRRGPHAEGGANGKVRRGMILRVRHRLFTFAAGLSAVLCAAFFALTVRSLDVADFVMRDSGRFVVYLSSACGRLKVRVIDAEHPPPSDANRHRAGWVYSRMEADPDRDRRVYPSNGDTYYVNGGGFALWHGVPAPSGNMYPDFGAMVPSWSAVPATQILPAVWYFKWRKRRARSRAGLCPACGYDLRATPEDRSRYPLNYASRIGADRGY
jgi:hypothetical protein